MEKRRNSRKTIATYKPPSGRKLITIKYFGNEFNVKYFDFTMLIELREIGCCPHNGRYNPADASTPMT